MEKDLIKQIQDFLEDLDDRTLPTRETGMARLLREAHEVLVTYEPYFTTNTMIKNHDEIEIARLRRALGFARSVIKSGESWTDACDKELSLLPVQVPNDESQLQGQVNVARRSHRRDVQRGWH
mgnify:CR=1 FL=1|jgi:hypothetical protein